MPGPLLLNFSDGRLWVKPGKRCKLNRHPRQIARGFEPMTATIGLSFKFQLMQTFVKQFEPVEIRLELA